MTRTAPPTLFLLPFIYILLSRAYCTTPNTPPVNYVPGASGNEAGTAVNIHLPNASDEEVGDRDYQLTANMFGWAQWSQWSGCSKKCGDEGVQYQLRRCLDSYCSGTASRHRMCRLEPCNDNVKSNAESECSARTSHSPGLSTHWLPAIELDSCAITCRSTTSSNAEEKHFNATLPNGSRCRKSDVEMAACLEGKCMEVGCDDVIGSTSRVDQCGTCGGDGRECAHRVFRWSETLQYTPCDKSCGPDRQARPRPHIKRCPNVPCSSLARAAPSIFNDNDGESSRWYYKADNSARRDNSKPRLRASEWGECSVTCGKGLQTRTVECVLHKSADYFDAIRVPDYECDGQSKPPFFRSCHRDACQPEFDRYSYKPHQAGEKPDRPLAYLSLGSTASSIDMKEPEVNERESLMPGKLRAREASNLPSADNSQHGELARYPGTGGVYRWNYDEWTACTASCLGGRQRSSLKCVDLEKNSSVPTHYCDARERPIELTRACNKEPCPPEWEIGGWSQCSHSCGGGLRTRLVRCIGKVAKGGNGAEAGTRDSPEMTTLLLPEAQCRFTQRPSEREACGVEDCPPAWRVGKWSPCSVTCGAGEQKRSVECEQRTAVGSIRTFNPPYECMNEERPPTVQLCELGDSGGPREISPVGGYKEASSHHGKLTLSVGGSANLYEGTSIKVKCPVRNFNKQRIFWTKDGRKIVNNAHTKVSGNGALRIFHARMEDAGQYTCYANGAKGNVTLQFKAKGSTTKPASKGAKLTKTKSKTKPKMKATKQAGIGASWPRMGSEKELLRKVKASLQRLREYRMLEAMAGLKNLSALRAEFTLGGWSPCSQVECGQPGSAQVRMIKCQLKFQQLMAYLEEEVCEGGFGLVRPPATRTCSNFRCPKWEASDWTECTTSRCIRHETAVQRRDVKCVYPNNGTQAEVGLCDRRSRPKFKRECANLNCTAEWRPSLWGRCSKSCGDGGVQMRLLRCVWKGTKKPAGKNCETSPAGRRPPAIRACSEAGGKELDRLPPCPTGSMDNRVSSIPLPAALHGAVCEDQSRFCDILKLFHSCDQESIRNRCCYSCHYLIPATNSSSSLWPAIHYRF